MAWAEVVRTSVGLMAGGDSPAALSSSGCPARRGRHPSHRHTLGVVSHNGNLIIPLHSPYSKPDKLFDWLGSHNSAVRKSKRRTNFLLCYCFRSMFTPLAK